LLKISRQMQHQTMSPSDNIGVAAALLTTPMQTVACGCCINLQVV
jgi:hypothetical protein